MLPDHAKMPWPPKEWAPHQADIGVADAWYAGDAARLRASSTASTPANQRKFRFWSRQSTVAKDQTDDMHVPVAADIAATAADLLFGDTPGWTIPEAHADIPEANAEATEARLQELAYLDGWASTLLEGAEIASALGGVYLRPVIDTSVVDHPMLTIVHPDCAVPEFRHGRLFAVTFWQQWDADEPGKVWRHLERCSPGVVEHGLYLGTVGELGTRRSMMDSERTAPLVRLPDGSVGEESVDWTQWHITSTPARYIPNALPNPKRRKDPVGRPDTGGAESQMDSLDETWASWVRDIRLAKARLIVPDEFLDHHGRGQGDTFDVDRELFSPLNMDPASRERAGIELVQPEVRFEAHAATAEALFTEIIQRAGYSPQSFGMQGDGAAITATEVDAHSDRSARTTGRKQSYWQRPLDDVQEMMLLLDAGAFHSGVVPMRPKVEWPAAAEADMRDTAATLNLLNLAKAVSTEVKVQLLHPDWTPTQVTEEAQRIQAENTTQVEDPMAGQA